MTNPLKASLKVDTKSSEPLYAQVKDSIRDYIQRNDLKPGSILPSERDLADSFQVSRLTIRKALDQLIREGRIFRRAGKGTYVSQPKHQQPLLILESFTEAILREGHTPGIQLLSMEVKEADFRISTRLELSPNSPVLKLRRLRSVDDLPFSLSTSHLPYHIVQNVEPEDLQVNSLYAILEDECGIELAKTQSTLDVTTATEYEADLLGVETGAPMFHMRGTVRDKTGQVVEFFSVLYRGDRMRFLAESE